MTKTVISLGIGISTSNYNKIFFIDHETLNIIKLSGSFSNFIDNLYEYKDEDLIEELIKITILRV